MTALAEASQTGVVGVIIAGGQARRLGGGDKTLLHVGERSMLERVIERLENQTSRLILNANGDTERFASFGLPIVSDALPTFGGPMFGLLAGMTWAQRNTDARWIVTAPSDAPFLPADLVTRLAAGLDDAEVAVCRSGGRLHPIIALWSVALADKLEAWLSTQPQRAAHAWLATRRWSAVDFDAQGGVDPFFNVNTPDDLAAARHHASASP